MNNNWKKINLFEINDQTTLYTKELGLFKIRSIEVLPLDDQGQRYTGLYSAEFFDCGKACISKDEIYPVQKFDIRNVFETQYFVLGEGAGRIPVGELKRWAPRNVGIAVQIPKWQVGIRIHVCDSSEVAACYERSRFVQEKFSFVVSGKKELEKMVFWATENSVKYERPALVDVSVGKKYFFRGAGECKVVALYDQPCKMLCSAKMIDGKIQEIKTEDDRFVCIPMEDSPSELAQFGDSLHELALQPMALVNENLINVMWQPIEEAVEYEIKLYRYVNEPQMRKLYHLKDYSVARGDHFLSIPGVITKGELIVVVTAQNRVGELVARSRGILMDGLGEFRPKFFSESDAAQ